MTNCIENQALWLAELKVTELAQTTGQFYRRMGNCYCALGVAGKMIGLSDDELEGFGTDPGKTDCWAAIEDWLGIGEEGACSVYELNDGHAFRQGPLTFKQVAEAIEEHPHQYGFGTNPVKD